MRSLLLAGTFTAALAANNASAVTLTSADSHGAGVCDREAAITGVLSIDHDEHHNQQLALLGVSTLFLLGAAIEHFSETLKIPFPYTMLLLISGCLLGVWVLYDPHFTLHPGPTLQMAEPLNSPHSLTPFPHPIHSLRPYAPPG